MNKAIFLTIFAAMAVLTASAGASSFNGYVNGRANVGASGSTNSIFGQVYQNISYNNANTINRTTILKQLATVAECRTNFVNTALPIVANTLKTNLNATEVDLANAKLQTDISNNASNPTIRSDVMVFDGSMLSLYGRVIGSAQGLNTTQVQGLRSQLNSSIETLQTCTSTNSIVKGSLGFHFGFGGLWLRFTGWWHHFSFHRR
jgi:hypothetical protein